MTMDYESGKVLTHSICEAIEAVAGRLGDIVETMKGNQAFGEKAMAEFRATQRGDMPEHIADEVRQRDLQDEDMSAAITALEGRVAANEQAMQSCLSTLGEVNKIVQALAQRN